MSRLFPHLPLADVMTPVLPGAEPGAMGFKELGIESVDLVGRLGQDTHSVSLCFHHGELGPVTESTD